MQKRHVIIDDVIIMGVSCDLFIELKSVMCIFGGFVGTVEAVFTFPCFSPVYK